MTGPDRPPGAQPPGELNSESPPDSRASSLPLRLEMLGVRRAFGSVQALDGVDLRVAPGEVHAVLGENGAGKSTLMNVLYGLLRPDAGQIRIDGERVSFTGPRDALAAGLGMVHQHFMLVGALTVAENVFLSAPGENAGRFRPRELEARTVELSERFGLRVDPRAPVAGLPVGVQQRVEILKALRRELSILILDEPTAVLTPQEAAELFASLRGLCRRGISVLFITHRLPEVRAAADRLTVLRAGRNVYSGPVSDLSDAELAERMVGRALVESQAPAALDPALPPLLEVRGLTVPGPSGPRVRAVDLAIRPGEILGIAGVEGNGQRELGQALVGVLPSEGAVTLDGRDIGALGAAGRTALGMGYVPDDRRSEALVLPFSIAENVLLKRHRSAPFARMGLLRPSEVAALGERLVREHDIRAPSARTPVSALSGGNQQRVVLARELDRRPRLIVALNPTRGLDVGAAEFVHGELKQVLARGGAVILISTDLDEVIARSNRIAVMNGGRLIEIEPGSDLRERVGLAMAGGGSA